MRFKMSEKSLFSYLLRSPWWLSFAIALVLGLAGRLILSEEKAPYALSIVIPFIFIGTIAAWKQLREPGKRKVAATVEAVSAMSWKEFSNLIESSFQREGYTVTRVNGAADFRIVKAGRSVLVCCKRWKAASLGLEPLRELESAREAQEAHEALYVTIGSITDNAQRFARDHRISLMREFELTRLLRLPAKAKKVSASN